jgi:hypothetical protein
MEVVHFSGTPERLLAANRMNPQEDHQQSFLLISCVITLLFDLKHYLPYVISLHSNLAYPYLVDGGISFFRNDGNMGITF